MTCSNQFLLLEFVCVYIFEVFMFAEIRCSLNIFRLLWYAPPESEYVAMRSGWSNADPTASHAAGAILHNAPEKGWMMRTIRNFRGPRSEVVHLKPWTLNGMSNSYKLLLLFAVAFPKLILSLCTSFVGAIYILSEGSGETGQREALLFSTLAVNFIGDFDHLIFEAFTSQPVKYQLEHMDPVVVDLSPAQCTVYWFLSAIVYPCVLFGGSAGMVLYFKYRHCDAYFLPWEEDSDYRWPWQEHMTWPLQPIH